MTGGIGAVIRQLRQSRGLTLRQLAAQLDIHFSHLSKIENGRDQPGRAVLNRVAQVLQVDLDVLLGEAGRQERPFRVLGRIAAGVPMDAIENVETFDLTRVFDPQDHFLLRVQGDSMILDGINDGDLAIIRHAQTARNGQTVAAVVDDEQATLKRYRQEGDVVILIPANERMQPMRYAAGRVRVCGVLTGLVRTLVR
ncbi:MAG: LexA family protein [Planctomyces sp.]